MTFRQNWSKAGGDTLVPAIHGFINSTWNSEQLPDQWKGSIIVPAHKKDDRTDSNY
jgi:hypothetical protein